MSHVSGAVNSCTTIATVDFYLPYFRKNATDAEAVRFGKMFGIVVVVLGILWATVLLNYSKRPIFIYLMNSYGYVTPGIATMFLLGILWSRATHAGALAAGAATIPLSILVEQTAAHLLPAGVAVYITPFANRTCIVFWTCMLIGIVVSLMTKPKSKEELEGLIWNRQSLRMPPEQRALYRGFRRPVIWWAIITAIVLYFFITYP
jgi:SSS family solute:Na+ symporter